MKIHLKLFASLFLLVLFSCNGEKPKSKDDLLRSKQDSLSYSLGVNIGKNLKAQKVDGLKMRAFTQALYDAMNGKDLIIKPREANRIVSDYFKTIYEASGNENQVDGKRFLEKNKGKSGVVVLPSGLQYKVIKEGKGAKPKADDIVRIHYTANLVNGEEVESTEKINKPAEFKLNDPSVIAGWQEALQLMQCGSRWKVFVPSELAYGPQPNGEKIQPFSTLIFEIELLAIE